MSLLYQSFLQLELGDHPRGLEAANQAFEVAWALGDERLLSMTELSRAAALGAVGQVRDAISAAQATIPRAEAAHHLEMLARAVGIAAHFSMIGGDFEKSRAYRRHEQAIAESIHEDFPIVFVFCSLAMLNVYLGEWQSARGYITRALIPTGSRTSVPAYILLLADLVLGQIALLEGDWDGAYHLFASCASRRGNAESRSHLEHGRARLDILTGCPGRAITRLLPMVQEVHVWDTDTVSLLPILAEAFLENGDLVRGKQCAEEAVERGTRQGNALALVDALRMQGVILAAEQRHEEADAAFERGLSLSRRMPYPYAEARTAHEWGVLAAQQCKPLEARDRFGRALAIFERLGSRKDVERTRGRLQTSLNDLGFNAKNRL